MILYKYYGFNAGIAALYSQKLGFREPRYFNDPFELSYLDNSDDADHIASKVNELKKSFVILSTTRTPCNPLMWAHYGEKHRGFVIGYEVDGEFLQSDDYNVLSVNEGDVVYTSSKEHFPLTEELKATLHKAFLISQGESISSYKGTERKNIETLLKKALLYKHSCWYYEEEVRVVKVLQPMFATCEEWQSNPNRSFTTLSKMVAPGIGCLVVNGLYIFNKKVPIKEVYLGIRNPLRQKATEDSIMHDSLAALAENMSWSVKLVNMSTGAWGLDSQDSGTEILKIFNKTEGLLNSFSFDENEAKYLATRLSKMDIQKDDQYELTNWSGEIGLKKNGEFLA